MRSRYSDKDLLLIDRCSSTDVRTGRLSEPTGRNVVGPGAQRRARASRPRAITNFLDLVGAFAYHHEWGVAVVALHGQVRRVADAPVDPHGFGGERKGDTPPFPSANDR